MNAAPTHSLEAVDRLELQLRSSLRPIQPSADFVDHLHNRLTVPPEMLVERRHHIIRTMLLVASALLGSVLAVWLLRTLRAS